MYLLKLLPAGTKSLRQGRGPSPGTVAPQIATDQTRCCMCTRTCQPQHQNRWVAAFEQAITACLTNTNKYQAHMVLVLVNDRAHLMYEYQ
jgi:hypothetical protein